MADRAADPAAADPFAKLSGKQHRRTSFGCGPLMPLPPVARNGTQLPPGTFVCCGIIIEAFYNTRRRHSTLDYAAPPRSSGVPDPGAGRHTAREGGLEVALLDRAGCPRSDDLEGARDSGIPRFPLDAAVMGLHLSTESGHPHQGYEHREDFL